MDNPTNSSLQLLILNGQVYPVKKEEREDFLENYNSPTE